MLPIFTCNMLQVMSNSSNLCKVQAAFYKIDIDNPDVQQSVSSHEIAAVVCKKLFAAHSTDFDC